MGKADNPFKELQDKIDALRSIELDTLEENINMALLINKDGDVSVEQILPIYTKILSKLLEVDETQDDGNSVDDGGDTGDEPREYLERKDLLHGIEVLQR